MPIFYNFHILLATFYTIFGTNILIQCPVPVPVCCMFFVSQNIHIKQSPNGIKTDGDFVGNIYDFWEEKSTRDDARGGHEGPTRVEGAPPTSWPPWSFLDVDSKSLEMLYFQKWVPWSFRSIGLRLVFLFFETLKQGKTETGTRLWVNRLVPKMI